MIARQKAMQLTQHKGVRQFVKFGIVGASSTIINFTIFNGMYRLLNSSLVPALTVAFLISCCNGFYWNRRWTFKQARSSSARNQGLKFLLVNLVGWFLDTSIVVLIVAHSTSDAGGAFGDWSHFKQIVLAIVAGEGNKRFDPLLVNGALAIATCIVVFWNFFVNRFWTFKHTTDTPPSDLSLPT